MFIYFVGFRIYVGGGFMVVLWKEGNFLYIKMCKGLIRRLGGLLIDGVCNINSYVLVWNNL